MAPFFVFRLLLNCEILPDSCQQFWLIAFDSGDVVIAASHDGFAIFLSIDSVESEDDACQGQLLYQFGQGFNFVAFWSTC